MGLFHFQQSSSHLAQKHRDFSLTMTETKVKFQLRLRALPLREFENRMQRKICGHKWEKRTNNWRKLHNQQLLDLYSSPEIITVITQASGIFGEGEKACWVFGGET